MTSDLGLWDPLDLAVAAELFANTEFRWWVTGGYALELHAERAWRSHADTDISFCRRDAGEVRRLLSGWDIHVAASGRLSPWGGEPPDSERHQNNLWCRRTPHDLFTDREYADRYLAGGVYRSDGAWRRAILRRGAL